MAEVEAESVSINTGVCPVKIQHQWKQVKEMEISGEDKG